MGRAGGLGFGIPCVEDKTAADIREAVGDLRARLQDTEAGWL